MKCNLCNKIFSSQYLLDKHNNRKTPCNIIIKCRVCDKVFEEERHLIRHNNRKKPCSPKLQIDKVQDYNKEEIKTKHIKQQLKARNELEEKRHERAIELLKLKYKLSLEKTIQIESHKTLVEEKTPDVIKYITDIENYCKDIVSCNV